jgi:hypothetical protein
MSKLIFEQVLLIALLATCMAIPYKMKFNNPIHPKIEQDIIV